MFQRDDDSEVIIRERLKVYRQETDPVVERYKGTGNILEIDGSLPIRVVEKSLRKALG